VARLLEIKPDGTEVWFHHDPIAKTNTIEYKQADLEPVLDWTRALRLASEYSKKGIKRDWWHYCHIPNIIVLKLKTEYGLDVYNKNHQKRVFEVINRDFPYLKATDGKHIPRN
jgi:hypothetical protein